MVRAVTSAVVKKKGGDQRDKQSARERARKGFYYMHIYMYKKSARDRGGHSLVSASPLLL